MSITKFDVSSRTHLVHSFMVKKEVFEWKEWTENFEHTEKVHSD